MGKILRIRKLRTFAEVVIVAAIVCLGIYLLKQFAPGLNIQDGVTATAIKNDNSIFDNRTEEGMLPKPGKKVSRKKGLSPVVNLDVYAWNCQSGLLAANGGPMTTEGSIMEANGVRLKVNRQDAIKTFQNDILTFVEALDDGEQHPSEGAAGIVLMGDGGNWFVSSMNKSLADKYGEGKYTLEVVGAVGMSNGEDKLIGPPEWKSNPESMKGALIDVVIGDGDWVTAVNYISSFGDLLKINPNPDTYDPGMVNFRDSDNWDYIESAKSLIKSKNEGYTYEYKESINGRLTGEKVNVPVTGCATWTPGDKMVFDECDGLAVIASTKDYVNQMPTTLIFVKQYAQNNRQTISNILKSALNAGNQIKLYDEWRWIAAECVQNTYKIEDTNAQYWYTMFDGQEYNDNGINVSVGGSRVFNYADALQYYGKTDGINRYKAVWDQTGEYLMNLNPMNFVGEVGATTPYSKGVNLSYLMNIDEVETTPAIKPDYSQTAKQVFATGQWSINFATNSANISQSSNATIRKIYGLLTQAENTKLNVVGHTDNVGNDELNFRLSNARAKSVVAQLISMGIPLERFQTVVGKGETEAIGDNNTSSGRKMNRRVEIQLLQ